jgi:hypothetical protein
MLEQMFGIWNFFARFVAIYFFIFARSKVLKIKASNQYYKLAFVTGNNRFPARLTQLVIWGRAFNKSKLSFLQCLLPMWGGIDFKSLLWLLTVTWSHADLKTVGAWQTFAQTINLNKSLFSTKSRYCQ